MRTGEVAALSWMEQSVNVGDVLLGLVQRESRISFPADSCNASANQQSGPVS